MIFSYKKKGGNYHSEKKKSQEAPRSQQTGCLAGENETLPSCELRGRLGGVHTRRRTVGTRRPGPGQAGSRGLRHPRSFPGHPSAHSPPGHQGETARSGSSVYAPASPSSPAPRCQEMGNLPPSLWLSGSFSSCPTAHTYTHGHILRARFTGQQGKYYRLSFLKSHYFSDLKFQT